MNAQSRKWQLVINSSTSYGLDHATIIEKCKLFMPRYFCLADEIAPSGTFHTHIFIWSDSPIRFSTLKDRFPVAHIEKAYGSASENRDYITKSGKWADTDKAETSIEGSFYEFGTVPDEKEERNPVQSQLLKDLYDGKRTAQIVEETPSLVFKVKDIDILRNTLLSERFAKEFRMVEVTYLWGASGTGKTKSIYQKYPANEICRITNYRQKGVSFDSYNGQDVLVFEEFYSQIEIAELLNYLDIYPLTLPARYQDKVACYTSVYITSNIPLTAQYVEIQLTHPETWRAFLRRIHKIIEFLPDGTTHEVINNKKG